MNNKINIAILAGGNSSEFEVSVKSAAFVFSVVDSTRYTPYLVTIKGKEWAVDINGDKVPIDKNTFGFTYNGTTTLLEYALIVIHGTPGEDGLLQSYFEIMSIPYSTCSPVASVITFNKRLTKLALAGSGVYLAKDFILLEGGNYSTTDIISKVGLPMFVKPTSSGSSFGIAKVKQEIELTPAINQAFLESNEVIIEEFIEGTEVSCGIMVHNGRTVLFPPTEIVSKNEFFDYEAKYMGKVEEITPARISSEELSAMYESMQIIYQKLNLRALVRMDFIIKDGKPYFIEVNTVPGMSPTSLIPQQAKAMGISATELINMIIFSTIKK